MGGAGILPIAIHNNEIYLFFGREALIPKLIKDRYIIVVG